MEIAIVVVEKYGVDAQVVEWIEQELILRACLQRQLQAVGDVLNLDLDVRVQTAITMQQVANHIFAIQLGI